MTVTVRDRTGLSLRASWVRKGTLMYCKFAEVVLWILNVYLKK